MKTRTKMMAGLAAACIFIIVVLAISLQSGDVPLNIENPEPVSIKPDIRLENGPRAVARTMPFDGIDKILDQMQLAGVAFNSPTRINIRQTALIQLLLDLSKSSAELKGMIEAEGRREGAQVRVSDRMQARLTGPNFSITAITPEVQAISGRRMTEWKWEVRPLSRGRQRLHLTLSALLDVDGASTPRTVQTFDREIEVEVTWPQQAASFLENNWQWLWAALLLPALGWIWKKKKGSSTPS